MRRANLQTSLGLVGLALLMCSCGSLSSIAIGRTGGHSVQGHDQGGPPPHAPAHGYRAKQRGSSGSDVELVFDSDLGVYIVVGIPDRYYWNGYYLRIVGEQWSASVELDGRWQPRSADSLPPGLRKNAGKSHKNAKSRSKKSHRPAKGKW